VRSAPPRQCFAADETTRLLSSHESVSRADDSSSAVRSLWGGGLYWPHVGPLLAGRRQWICRDDLARAWSPAVLESFPRTGLAHRCRRETEARDNDIDDTLLEMLVVFAFSGAADQFAGWRTEALERLALTGWRNVSISVSGRPTAFCSCRTRCALGCANCSGRSVALCRIGGHRVAGGATRRSSRPAAIHRGFRALRIRPRTPPDLNVCSTTAAPFTRAGRAHESREQTGGGCARSRGGSGGCAGVREWPLSERLRC
jgi:hypothetical protein